MISLRTSQLLEIERQLSEAYSQHINWFRYANQLELNLNCGYVHGYQITKVFNAKIIALRFAVRKLIRKGYDLNLVLLGLSMFLKKKYNHLFYINTFLEVLIPILSELEGDFKTPINSTGTNLFTKGFDKF